MTNKTAASEFRAIRKQHGDEAGTRIIARMHNGASRESAEYAERYIKKDQTDVD
jgi:hypothetical protein